MTPTTDAARFRVMSEPDTYRPDGEHSFWRDLGLLTQGSAEARSRLDRHSLEHRDQSVRADRERRRWAKAAGVEFEQRVNPGRNTSNFAPPGYYPEYYAQAPRPNRVLADLFPNLELPQGASSVNFGRIVSGDTAAGVADISGEPSTDLTDAAVTAQAVSVVGAADFSLQALEQSPQSAPLDKVIYADLMSAVDASLEAQLMVGAGTGYSQCLGLLNVSSPAVSVSYTSGSPTGTGLVTASGQLFGQVADARRLRPQVFLMRGGRWGWLAASLDSQNRPFSTPGDAHGFWNQGLDRPGPEPVGSLIGIPVYSTESIPSNLSTTGTNAGTGTNDVLVTCRPSDVLLFESETTFEALMEPLSGSLGVRLRARRYCAATTARFPAGVGVLSGTGLVYPTGA